MVFVPGALCRELGNPIRDLFLGRRQIDPSRSTPCTRSRMSRASSACSSPTFSVTIRPCASANTVKGKTVSMPNAAIAVRSVLFTDQYRIVDAHLACVLLHGIAEVDGDADDFDASLACSWRSRLQQRDFAAAGLAPGRPEIDHQRPALPFGQGVFGSTWIGQGNVGQIGWDGVLCRRRRFGDLRQWRSWRGVDNHLRAGSTTQVSSKKPGRASHTNDRNGERDTQPLFRTKPVFHVEPGIAALRLGLIALVTRAAKSGAFM